jgi:hypothetical protein
MHTIIVVQREDIRIRLLSKHQAHTARVARRISVLGKLGEAPRPQQPRIPRGQWSSGQGSRSTVLLDHRKVGV